MKKQKIVAIATIIMISLNLVLAFSIYDLFNFFSVNCAEEKIVDTYIQQADGRASYTFTCQSKYNQGCRYEIFDCNIPRMWAVYKSPASSGSFGVGETITLFCGDGSKAYYGQIGVRIFGKYCSQDIKYSLNIMTNNFYTTKDDVVIQVFSNAPDGHIIFAKIGGVEKFSALVSGKTTFNFGKLQKGNYNLEVWGNNIDIVIRNVLVIGKMNVYFTTDNYEQNAGNVYACLHIEDENGRLLTPNELKSIKLNVFMNGAQQNADIEYLSSPCLDSYKVHAYTTNIGDVVFKAVIEKYEYKTEEASVTIGVEKPILIVDTSKTPNSANLGDEIKFTIDVKGSDGNYVDVDTIKVNVINPKATYNKDITNNIIKTSKGSYVFYYKLDETDKWSFDIVVEKANYGRYSYRHLISVTGKNEENKNNLINTILISGLGVLAVFVVFTVVKK